MKENRIVLIAGPTASGKSTLAMRLAEAEGGVVINADSMQVYRELRVVTARPGPEEEVRVPHRLYGHVAAAEGYSVARWLVDAAGALQAAAAAGRPAFVVGGTGLYFKALTEGLSPIPAIPEEVRARWRQASLERPAMELHAELAARDPLTAGRLRPSDPQRIVRALEVLEATGRPLAEWQQVASPPLLPKGSYRGLVVDRPREELHRRSDRRFREMMEQGAVEEVEALLALQLPADLPVMRAVGVPEVAAHLAGAIDRETAIARAQTASRQYIKRQLAWLRRNMIAWEKISTHDLQN